MRKAKALLIFIGGSVFLFAVTAQADNPRVTEPTDFWFQYDQPTQFYARTFAVDGYWSDPMLWLYNSEDVLIAVNDDFYGLQSEISIPVEAGLYRLRAGVCCHDPNRWYEGVQYDLSTTGVPTTTIGLWETTTTTIEPTPTSELSTTTTVEPTTTTVLIVPPSSSLPTLSSTTTTLPDPPTTTSTLSLPTTTVQSTTSVVSQSPSTVLSSSTSVPPSVMSSTTTLTTPLITSTTSSEGFVSPVETTSTTNPTLTTPFSETTNQNGKTFTRRVSLGPINITITATESQRRTVVAAAIVQLTAVATISTTGVSANSSNPRRNR